MWKQTQSTLLQHPTTTNEKQRTASGEFARETVMAMALVEEMTGTDHATIEIEDEMTETASEIETTTATPRMKEIAEETTIVEKGSATETTTAANHNHSRNHSLTVAEALLNLLTETVLTDRQGEVEDTATAVLEVDTGSREVEVAMAWAEVVATEGMADRIVMTLGTTATQDTVTDLDLGTGEQQTRSYPIEAQDLDTVEQKRHLHQNNLPNQAMDMAMALQRKNPYRIETQDLGTGTPEQAQKNHSLPKPAQDPGTLQQTTHLHPHSSSTQRVLTQR